MAKRTKTKKRLLKRLRELHRAFENMRKEAASGEKQVRGPRP